MHCGRLSLLTFFGETKKVSGCRAAPGNAPSSEENKAHQSTMLRKQRNAKRVVRPSRLQRHSTRHPEGAMHCGRLSLLTFFGGETKKVSGCRAAPGNAPSSEENKHQVTTELDISKPLSQKIKQGAQRLRNMFARGIHAIHIEHCRFILGQQGHQLTGSDIRFRSISRQMRNASAGQCPMQQHHRFVGADVAAYSDRATLIASVSALPARKFP